MHSTSESNSSALEKGVFNAHTLLQQVVLPLLRRAIETCPARPGPLAHQLDGLALVLEQVLTELERAVPDLRDRQS